MAIITVAKITGAEMITDERLQWLSSQYAQSEPGQIAGELLAARAALREVRDFEPVTNGNYAVMEAIPALRKIAIAALGSAAETSAKPPKPAGHGEYCVCDACMAHHAPPETPAKRKRFYPRDDDGGALCVHCKKTIAYHYQTAEGDLFCEVPSQAKAPRHTSLDMERVTSKIKDESQ